MQLLETLNIRGFKNKFISLGETNETDYWLEIIEEINWSHNNKIKDIRKEAKELLAIFTSIASKL